MYGGPARRVDLVIHHDHDRMLRAIRRARPDDTTFDDDTAGACLSFGTDRIVNSVTGEQRWAFDNPDPMAVIHLQRGWVTSEVVVHELVHAAAVIWRRDIANDVRLGTASRSMEREEWFAYMVGELSAKAADALGPRGLWTVSP